MATTELPGDIEHASTNFEVGTALLEENDRVRVWEIKLQPGERCAYHCHRTSYFWVAHEDGVARAGFSDGTSEDYRHTAGEVTYIEVAPGEPVIHDLTNVGDTPLVFTTIELLRSDRLFWRDYEGALEGHH